MTVTVDKYGRIIYNSSCKDKLYFYKENLEILNEQRRQASFIKCLIGSLTML